LRNAGKNQQCTGERLCVIIAVLLTSVTNNYTKSGRDKLRNGKSEV